MSLSYAKFVSSIRDTSIQALRESGRTCLESATRSKAVSQRCQERVEIRVDAQAQRLWAQSPRVCPIHVCGPQDLAFRSRTTHHYCGIFSDVLLAAPRDTLYVMIDRSCAEEVSFNRDEPILMTSYDGNMSVWGAYYTFTSENFYVAGTPIFDASGALVSTVTCRVGDKYAVSSFEKEISGFMETNLPPLILEQRPGAFYGGKFFDDRDDLKAYIKALNHTSSCRGTRLVAMYGAVPRVSHVCECGRQLSSVYCGRKQTVPEYL